MPVWQRELPPDPFPVHTPDLLPPAKAAPGTSPPGQVLPLRDISPRGLSSAQTPIIFHRTLTQTEVSPALKQTQFQVPAGSSCILFTQKNREGKRNGLYAAPLGMAAKIY